MIGSSYDASAKKPDPDPSSPSHAMADHFTRALEAPLTGAMTRLARERLGFKGTRKYVLSNDEAFENWDWGNNPAGADSVSLLREELALDARLKVFVAHGYTDLVTPYFESVMIFEQMPAFDGRVRLKLYGGAIYFSAAMRAGWLDAGCEGVCGGGMRGS